MSAKPEALRLADLFELEADPESLYRKAAAELRCLHAANLDCIAWFKEAMRERDELLKALEQIIEMNIQFARDKYGDPLAAENMSCVRVARAAIAKVNGEQP
jgi:hypothetical protein